METILITWVPGAWPPPKKKKKKKQKNKNPQQKKRKPQKKKPPKKKRRENNPGDNALPFSSTAVLISHLRFKSLTSYLPYAGLAGRLAPAAPAVFPSRFGEFRLPSPTRGTGHQNSIAAFAVVRRRQLRVVARAAAACSRRDDERRSGAIRYPRSRPARLDRSPRARRGRRPWSAGSPSTGHVVTLM